MPSFPSPEPTVSYFDDLDYFNNFEKEFPAIIYNDALTSKLDFLTEPTINPQHIDEFNSIDETSLSEFDIEHSSGDLSVKPLPDVINIDVGAYAQGTVDTAYSLNEYSVYDTGINTAYPRGVFISRAWRRLFEIRGLLEFFSTFKFGEVVVDLDMAGALQFQLGGGPDDEICHRLIACSIVGRSQAPKKLDDMWSWVAPGPERQPNVAAGAFEAAKDAPAVDEGALADPTPMQVPQPPHAAPRTMPQRIMRLEEDVYEL
ncbi:hypothetical protein Tco_1130937 [Tanacetum coccineum]